MSPARMPTSTPSRPPSSSAGQKIPLPQATVGEALAAHGAEARLALAELAANPALPALSVLLGEGNLGRAFTQAPLDLAQAAAELAPLLPTLSRLHTLSARPALIGRVMARSLPSFMKGLRTIAARGWEGSLAELEALLPEAVRRDLPRPFPEAESEAETLLALLARLTGQPDDPPPPSGLLPVGCEVEIPHLPGYPAAGVYLFALFAGLPLGEDELIEFSLPPALGADTQVRLIDALAALGLLPPGQTLSLHITCETPEEAAPEALEEGMGLVSFTLAFLYSAQRRLAAGQIFRNFRLKRRGIRGLKWEGALGAEYRLANVCTGSGEPGVLGSSLRAHEAQIRLAVRLHAALIDHCLGRGSVWQPFREGLEGWVEARGLRELVEREINVTGELATLFAGRRTPGLQEELAALVGEPFGPGAERGR